METSNTTRPYMTGPSRTHPSQRQMLLFPSKPSADFVGRKASNHQSFCLHFAGFPLSPPVRKRTILPLEPSFRVQTMRETKPQMWNRLVLHCNFNRTTGDLTEVNSNLEPSSLPCLVLLQRVVWRNNFVFCFSMLQTEPVLVCQAASLLAHIVSWTKG